MSLDQRSAVTASASTGSASILWPSGGFQWRDEWRKAMPVVRGINAPPLSIDATLFDKPPVPAPDRFNFLGQSVEEMAKAVGRSWKSWDRAEFAHKLTRQALSQPDMETWLEASGQLGSVYIQRSGVEWLTRAAITLHGLAFAVELALEFAHLYHAFNSRHMQTEQFALLRQAIACADERNHAEALEVATRLRERTDFSRLACAYLFPHMDAWAVECVERGIKDEWALLKDCVMPVSVARAYAKDRLAYLYYMRSALFLQVHLHGEQAFDLLAQTLNKAQGKDDTIAAVDILTSMRVPQMIGALVAEIEKKEVRAALDKLAQEYPAAVLKTAIEATLATRSRTVEGWTVRLALRQPEALQPAQAALDAASAAKFSSVLASLDRETVPSEQLPELLRNPPWLNKARAQELPIFEMAARLTPTVIGWSAQEREKYASLKAGDGYLHRVPKKESPEIHLLRELGIADAAHARILKGELMQEGDFVKPDYFFGRPIETLAQLPDRAALALWNSYPPQNWYSWSTNGEVVKALLARNDVQAIPGLIAYAQVHPQEAFAAALQIDTPQLVPVALHALRNLKKAKAIAIDWIKAHVPTVLAVALPLAFGSNKTSRENAQFGVRWLAQNGFEAQVTAAAKDYGGQMPDAVHALLAQDPLKVLPAKMPKLPTYFVAAAFRRPELPDGRALPASAVEHIGSMLAISKADALYAGLDVVRATCTRASLAEFAWDVFEAWMAAGAPSKESWAFLALGWLGDDETARRLAPKIREWPGEAAHARAVTGLDILAAIGTDVALMHLNGIAGKVKFKALQDRAREKIEAVAEARGFTAMELADRLVPDLGLDDSGSLELNFGERKFFVSFDETLKPFVKDAQGARLKDLPKPLKSDDAELAKAATDRYKQVKKDAKAIASLQITRLEMAMVTRRRWPAADFRMFFLDHPLMRHLAARLAWGVYAKEQVTQAFRIAEDWTLADENDTLYTLPEDASVGIAHVLEMPQAMQAAFGQIFADYEILQPFKQLGRETYTLTKEEQNASSITRFKDKVVATGSVMGLVNRGWERGMAMDAGWVGHFIKRFGELQVDLQLDPGTVVGDPTFEPKQKLPAITLRKAGTWEKEGLVSFGTVSPILASEVLRDVDLLAPLKE